MFKLKPFLQEALPDCECAWIIKIYPTEKMTGIHFMQIFAGDRVGWNCGLRWDTQRLDTFFYEFYIRIVNWNTLSVTTWSVFQTSFMSQPYQTTGNITYNSVFPCHNCQIVPISGYGSHSDWTIQSLSSKKDNNI